MKIEYAEAIAKDPALSERARRASEILAFVLGQPPELVEAEWDRLKDRKGRDLIVLRLSDGTGSMATVFSSEELENEQLLTTRLYALWGDLLQARSGKQLRRMRELVSQLAD